MYVELGRVELHLRGEVRKQKKI